MFDVSILIEKCLLEYVPKVISGYLWGWYTNFCNVSISMSMDYFCKGAGGNKVELLPQGKKVKEYSW